MLDKQNIYLIGIGGIGMSALARYFAQSGKQVAGYDRSRSSLCEVLEREGMTIHYEDSVEQIPTACKNPDQTLVIYTPAVPADHSEFLYFQEQGFTMAKRARVLGAISENHQCLAVAGTHGKTTTSALLAHILVEAGMQPTAFLGGVATNYQSNFIAGEGSILVAEADEYDRSFLQLKPNGAIITSVDSDHLDIYGDANELLNTFRAFNQSVDGPRIVHRATGLEGITYSLAPNAVYHVDQLRVKDHRYHFDIVLKDNTRIKDIASGLPGRHNVENALAAAALAYEFGVTPPQLKNSIESFKGVSRRFEYHIKRDDLVFIDDYAHHPEELKALLTSVRELYPGKRISGIFQPHLYSRTRDYLDEFAVALAELDELLLMDIYPAREKPIAGVTSQKLLERVQVEHKKLLNSQAILDHLSQHKPEVVLTMGAGDIDRLVNPLKMKLSQ